MFAVLEGDRPCVGHTLLICDYCIWNYGISWFKKNVRVAHAIYYTIQELLSRYV